MNFVNSPRMRQYWWLLMVLLPLLFSGCGAKRWSGAVAEEEEAGIRSSLATLQELEKECPDSLDADARIFWESPMDEWAVEGYLQLLSPSFVKFVITNPLGQPIYAFAASGEWYQILQPRRRQHIRGRLHSLVMRKEMPLILAGGDWFSYLTGRMPTGPLEILEINRDTSNDSLWLRLSSSQGGKTKESIWLHLDPLQGTVLGYLFLDGKGKTLAEITYEHKEAGESRCNPQRSVMLTGLPWGSSLRIEFERVSSDSMYGESDFVLPVPEGYATQIRP